MNSVLIEGSIVATPTFETDNGHKICTLILISKQLKSDNHDLLVRVVARNKLAEAIYTSAYPGRGLRVVGRLNKDGNGLFIEAEHIELRPEFK
jgi:single-stranded DNA-binding protein